MQKILIVDDDPDMCVLLTRFLTRKGYTVASAVSGKAAMEWLKKNKPSLILCDFRLDDMTGAELLIKMKAIHHSVPVIIITGYSEVKDAVDVMKLGAYDYITKPLYPDELLLTITRALEERLSDEGSGNPDPSKASSGKAGKDASGLGDYITGGSPEFAAILKQIELVAPTNFSVIIYGESGSGKEAIAQQIHRKSKRADKPFVAIDCGALSKDLAGSELFGHEKGAFTGALSQKIGSLEYANGGTVFLDEIGNLSYDTQVSLLRVVQERKIRRIGGVKDIDLDVRILVASNERLWEAARAGRFREDLFHRFNEFSIEVPALRNRTEDIMVFAHYFLKLTNAELGKNVTGFTKEVEDILNNYIWYGNLRELKNVVKRATLLTDNDIIEAKSLPFEINNFTKLQFDPQASLREMAKPSITQQTDGPVTFEHKLRNANLDAEYNVILDALKQSNFNKSKAAKLLNIDRKTLYNKMRQFKEFNIE